jgi:ABC-2 type transport system permease protein
MFRSIALATFRGQRRAAVAWGTALAFFALFTMWTNWRREYPTEEARQRLAEQVDSRGVAFAQVLFGEPSRIDQFAGHLEWRVFGLYPLLLGLFMVMSASAVSRGAEERGELDVLLTVPRRRVRLFAEQSAGLALALLVACLFIWASVLLSGPAAGEPLPPADRALLSTLNLGLAAAFFGSLTLLLGQFARSRRAAGTAAGAVLVASFLWSNLCLVATALESWRWISPLYLTSRSTPLADGHVSVAGLTLTAALTVASLAVACWLFARRDAGAVVPIPWPAFIGSVLRRLGRSEGRTWLLGGSVQSGIRAALAPMLLWGMGAALFATLFTAITPSIRRGFEDLPEAREAAERIQFDVTSDVGIISALLFLVLPLLACLFAATLTSGMASQEAAGRLELELTYPVGRRAYFLQRVAASLAAIAGAVTLASAAFLTSAFLLGLDLDWGRAAAASLLLVLPPWIVLSFGYGVAGWRPRMVAGAVAGTLAASFFFDLLAPALDLPGTVQKLSIFQLYGQPLVEGVSWGDTAVMLALIVGCTAAGALAFARRDILK